LASFSDMYKKFHAHWQQQVKENKIQDNIIFSLQEIKSIRNEGEELQELELSFTKTSYLHHRTMCSIWQSLDYKTKWEMIEKYPNFLRPEYATSFGVQVAVITVDNYLIFTRRSQGIAISPTTLLCSMTEGMSSMDVDASGNPDFFNTAKRGLKEELEVETSKEEIHFLTLFINFETFHVGFFGYTDMRSQEYSKQLTLQDLEEGFKNGPKDKFETQKLEPIEFTLPSVKQYIQENTLNGLIAGGTLVGVIHLLWRCFGKEAVLAEFKKQ